MSASLAAKSVAIYARYSSDNQKEHSIDDQVRRCREYIERAGGAFDPALVFADHAVSGASVSRPAFEKMMAAIDAKPRKIDAVVTEDVSRVSRDFADAALVFKRLQYVGVPLISVGDGIDTSSPSAKLTYTVKSLVADIYLDDLRDKTKRGLTGRALAGHSTGGLPFGYASKPVAGAHGHTIGHEIVIAEESANIVRDIFARYLAGRSLTAIATEFNAAGTPPPRAHTRHRRKGWVASTIRAILHNAAYVGEWTYMRREWRKVPGTNARRPRARPEGDVLRFDRPHLRIIDVETWDATQARLRAIRNHYSGKRDGRKRGSSSPSGRSSYPFSGLLVCDTCGAPMVIAGGSSARYYKCGDSHCYRAL